MESVLRGKAPWEISRVKPQLRCSIRSSKIKNQPVQSDSSECTGRLRIPELLFHDCLSGAVISAGAAADADIGVDDVLLVALRDSLDGAVVGTLAALNASISNLVSHDSSSICL